MGISTVPFRNLLLGCRASKGPRVGDDPVRGGLGNPEQRGELPQGEVRPPVRGHQQDFVCGGRAPIRCAEVAPGACRGHSLRQLSRAQPGDGAIQEGSDAGRCTGRSAWPSMFGSESGLRLFRSTPSQGREPQIGVRLERLLGRPVVQDGTRSAGGARRLRPWSRATRVGGCGVGGARGARIQHVRGRRELSADGELLGVGRHCGSFGSQTSMLATTTTVRRAVTKYRTRTVSTSSVYFRLHRASRASGSSHIAKGPVAVSCEATRSFGVRYLSLPGHPRFHPVKIRFLCVSWMGEK
ncbi:hypothetical protein SPILM97S_00259 [Streptomyces pilosus]